MDVVNPATEEVIAEVASADRSDVDAAVAAARAALNGPWSALSARERGRLVRQLGERLHGAGRRGRAPRDAAQRQADQRIAAHRDPGRGRMLRVLRRLVGQGDGRDDSREGQSPHLHAARAGRRGRRHRALELPAAARGVEGRAGAGLRQHRHSQAGEPDAADRPGARRAGAGGGLSAGRPERRHRRRVRPSVRRSSSIPASTRSRSPATPAPARGSCGARRTRSRRSRWSSAASRRTSCCPTPTSTPPSAARPIGIFYGKGEVCAAGSRLLVDRSIKDEFVDKLAARAKKMTAGDPMDPKTRFGAISSTQAARDRAATTSNRESRKGRRSSPAAREPTSARARATSCSRPCSPTSPPR